MSGPRQPFQYDRALKILVIGRDKDELEAVVDEARAAGVDARGMTVADADGALTGWFDVIAFCSGLSLDERTSLEREALFHNPDARFQCIFAPHAGSELRAATRPRLAPTVDLDAYFERIGYSGPAEPTLDVLRALHQLHPAAIPFEAIDVLLGRGIDISPEAVDAKLIERRRGGYCYEQNGLFARVLTTIGFEVEGLAAHVRWMSEPGSQLPPLTHRVLRVTIEGRPWLADVGFGSAVPTEPLRLDEERPQETRFETYRVRRLGPQRLLQALVDGEWRPVYSIASEPWLDSHYEMANWYTSTHAASHFRHRLIVARTTREARHVLANGKLTIRRPDGSMEKSFLDAEQILEVLDSIFGLPVEAQWRDLAERAARDAETERKAEAA